MRILSAIFLMLASPAFAQTPGVLSPAPDKVAVTIYRDPDRNADDSMDLDDLSSFALITETRTVDLPPGVATIRFEGVAGGIIPQSAILFGGDIREKNRDAALLSQMGLLDAFTGQRVTLRRTDPATGMTSQETAIIRSAADRLVVTTPRGVEAIYCSGLNQTLLFNGVPSTLSAKPVLSMVTKPQQGGRVTITLAYLASRFDWDATYVGELSQDGSKLNLFAWLTIGSGDETSFVDATAAAVAGTVARSEATRDDTGNEVQEMAEGFNRRWGCWPEGTTSDLIQTAGAPTPVSPVMEMEFDGAMGEIVVTASKRNEMALDAPLAVSVIADAENLGDLKLYRIPIPVTVAAQSQKQVAFLQKPTIDGKLLYRARFGTGGYDDDVEMLFRFRNNVKSGAGVPLPAGQVALFQQTDDRRMLVGETQIAGKTVDEEVDLVFGEASNVTVENSELFTDKGQHDYEIVIRNANPFPIGFEAEFPNDANYARNRFSGKVVKRPGKTVWIATIRANDEQRLRYSEREIKTEEEE
jgi:hypothetical protein